MTDQSHLDKKYFIDDTVYNCPFCNRNNVTYSLYDKFHFNWNENKDCYGYIIKCKSCGKKSLHLSYSNLLNEGGYFRKEYIDNIDNYMFYSVPTSFFVTDNKIHSILRELIAEAEGCLKMNYLTGASACIRKAIYEFTVIEKAKGEHYEDKIKSLKRAHPESSPILFDILSDIQGMTSDKIHEQSWDKWESKNLKLIIETLKTILYDIYVTTEEKQEKYKKIIEMRTKINEK